MAFVNVRNTKKGTSVGRQEGSFERAVSCKIIENLTKWGNVEMLCVFEFLLKLAISEKSYELVIIPYALLEFLEIFNEFYFSIYFPRKYSLHLLNLSQLSHLLIFTSILISLFYNHNHLISKNAVFLPSFLFDKTFQPNFHSIKLY